MERIRQEIKAEKRQAEEARAEEDNVEEAIGLSRESSGLEPDGDHGIHELYEVNIEMNPADVKRDLVSIIDFFANAPSDGVDDEQLWAELKQRVCFKLIHL